MNRFKQDIAEGTEVEWKWISFMLDASQSEQRTSQVGGLPRWWRHVLVAIATLILCSCSSPLPLDDSAGLAAALSPATGEPAKSTYRVEPAQVEMLVPTEESSEVIINEERPVAPTWIDQMTDQGESPIPPVPSGETSTISENVGSDYVDRLCASGACAVCQPTWFLGPGDEYLCDGGDFGSPAGVRADWTIDGLDEEDAIAHYDTLDGRVIVTPSNRVCLYAPRFAAVRRVVNLMAHEQPEYVNVALEELSPAKASKAQPVVSSLQRHQVGINLGQQPPSLYRQRQQAGGLENLQATMDVYNSLGPYANLQIIRTGVVDNAEKPWLAMSIESAIALTGVQAAQVVFGVKQAHAQVGVQQAGVIYQTDGPDNPRLRLVKLASCGHALPGEEIEFTLRFDNVGDQVIGNVTIADNLSTRFEYIPKTARSSVDANFLVIPNDDESSILRWEIKDPLKPDDGGVLRFRVRVR